MKRLLLRSVLAILAMAALIALVIGSGVYNVAADEEHTTLVYNLIEATRERSIAVRAARVDVPELADPQRVRRGAGNYDSMCAGCHLKPDADETELSRGLYPKPPDLATAENLDPARTFWVIKHGIKATGMPAWGKSMEDRYIWDMVAFLSQLPTMSAEQYAAEVRASGGHSHGETESTSEGDEHGDSPSEGEHSHDKTAAETSLPNDVLGAVKAFHEALSAGNSAAVERALDPRVVIMEGGNVERSRDEYASHHLKSDVKFMSAMKYTLERQSGDNVGDMAWVASEATLTGESQGKAVDLASNESLVLKRTSAGWRIVHIHWSSRNRAKAWPDREQQ